LEQDPLVIKRQQDGKWVKLYCTKCQPERSDFKSVQGFISHCRILHKDIYASHEEAANACGRPIEVKEVSQNNSEEENDVAFGTPILDSSSTTAPANIPITYDSAAPAPPPTGNAISSTDLVPGCCYRVGGAPQFDISSVPAFDGFYVLPMRKMTDLFWECWVWGSDVIILVRKDDLYFLTSDFHSAHVWIDHFQGRTSCTCFTENEEAQEQGTQEQEMPAEIDSFEEQRGNDAFNFEDFLN
jgi:hypothetical protein